MWTNQAVASRALVAVPLLAAFACSSGTTEVILQPVETIVAAGDRQYGTAGQILPTSLHVVVRGITTELPQEDRNVLWTVASGDAEIVGIASVLTDETGSARVKVRLGTATGEVSILARVQDQETSSAVFTLYLVDRPVLAAVSPATASPGSSVTLIGQNFSPDADHNVVLFSGLRGRVTAASTTQLTVTVPLCLTARSVEITAQLGMVASSSTSLQVLSAGSVESLAVGESVFATDPEGFSCVTVPGDGAASYLVMVQSTSEVGAAMHPVSFFGLSADGNPYASIVDTPVQASIAPPSRVLLDGPGRVQANWDARLREYEAEITRGRGQAQTDVPEGDRAQRVDRPAAVPSMGEQRTFEVFRGAGDFIEVTATARHIGQKAAFFVDLNSPEGGYTPADLQYFSDTFDQVIHPMVTSSFGVESDLDQNSRIVVLLTPAVNALTPRSASGFVGGFFFGVDLLPKMQGSNAAEIFYSLVPDPGGLFSDPRPRDRLLEVTPAILAHEYQHMVHFNERVLVRGAEANEATWLKEGLAQFSEELAARELDDAGDADAAELFRDGTVDRSRRYLAGPDSISLLISSGQGTLAERGAGFLYVMYLVDRFGSDLVGRLTRTTNTGARNVEAETRTDWATGLSDWWSAVWMDGESGLSDTPAFPGVDLKAFLGDPFPLEADVTGQGDFVLYQSLRSASVAYYIVTPAAGGSMTLRVGGESGGTSLAQAGVEMRIIRIH